MKRRPSPNFNDRAPTVALDYVVLHYTGMRNAAEALSRLCSAESEVSAHYLIDEDGEVTQLVDEEKRAWHAGKSSWRGVGDMNSASVGIELVNPGHEFGYRPFPAAQIAALPPLLGEIVGRHQLNPRTGLVAHSDIAPARKEDPGELFPWRDLAQAGFGLWPEPDGNDFTTFTPGEVCDQLRAIGYDITETKAAIAAFQRRYAPDLISGFPDPQSVARMRALNRLTEAALKG